MTKQHDDIADQDTTAAEVADGLKAWLAAPTQGDAQEEAAEAVNGPENASQKDVRPADTPAPPQDDAQELQDGTVDPQAKDTTTDDAKAADGPENAPQEDAPTDFDSLQRAYTDLQAKVAELEAQEAARIEAEEKSSALTAAGIKGNYSQLLTGSKDTWGEQIDMLKQFAADNAPAISVPRDPALDADLESEEEEITAEEFLTGKHNIL